MGKLSSGEITRSCWSREEGITSYIRDSLNWNKKERKEENIYGKNGDDQRPFVLKALLKKTEITQKELAQMCHVDQTTLSRNLDKLVQLGYVERKTDEECRRCFLISLTPTGSEKAKEVSIVFQELEKRLTNGFSEEEQKMLYSYLERMLCNLRNEEVSL